MNNGPSHPAVTATSTKQMLEEICNGYLDGNAH